MNFKEFDIATADFNPFSKTNKEWFLITAGDESGYNTMTASWGFFGTMWGKSVAHVVIRPQRHTLDFVEKANKFTISIFDEKYRSALQFCGTKSGRDFDKAKETGLTPLFLDGTTAFAEAHTILVCEKLFKQPMVAESFIDKTIIPQFYPQNDLHISYIGGIEKAYTVK